MALIGRMKKQPREVIDYPVDFSRWLAKRPGYSIDTYTVTAEPGIDVVTHQRVGAIVTVVMGGGTDGQKYKVTVKATTTPTALVKEAEFTIFVKEI